MGNAALQVATGVFTGQLSGLLDPIGRRAIQRQRDGAGDKNGEASSCFDVHGGDL